MLMARWMQLRREARENARSASRARIAWAVGLAGTILLIGAIRLVTL
jgi:hypothetical protein